MTEWLSHLGIWASSISPRVFVTVHWISRGGYALIRLTHPNMAEPADDEAAKVELALAKGSPSAVCRFSAG
jgi:hypothetical protein